MNTLSILILALISPLALAGGSHYGTPAGTLASFSGQVSEWPVPTPAFARGPAVAPDGSIFIAVMAGNKLARFDPAAHRVVRFDPRSGDLSVVKLPTPGAGIRKMIVDAQGQLWYMGSQSGRLGRVR